MKYYIKSAKRILACTGPRLYSKPKPEAYAFTLDQMLQFAFNLDGCTLLRQSKHSQRGTHYTLLCKVVRNYKTITPKKLPKDPQSSMGVFLSVVKPLLSVKGA